MANIYNGIVNKKVERTIDLTSQFAKHTVTIDIENTGSQSANEYFLAIQKNLHSKLSYVQVFEDSTSLKVEKVGDESSYVVYRVQLSKALAPSAGLKLVAKFYFSHSMTPFPASIGQAERQLVRYNDNHFFFTPYQTSSQTTTVKLPSAAIESKTEQAPTTVRGDSIEYGPYEDISAYSVSNMALHFENNKPFVTATSLVKEIEISHWGNVAIEETYELSHDGAKLKGTFSRFDYQRTQPGKSAVVPAFKQILPIGASDVYYRDEIGNISTSHLFETEKGPVMDVIPRYPLFGGWKIGFYLGYNLPSYAYLFRDTSDSSRHVLNVSFSSALEDVAVDQLTVRVILPEGAKDVEFQTPFDVDGSSSSVHYTYLDTSGRPVLLIFKKNLVPEHNQYFQVAYTFSSTSLLQEPILLITAFFLFFLFIMLYTRLPFSIGEKEKPRNTPLEKAEPVLLRLKEILDQRAEIHSNLAGSLAKYLDSKNSAAYNAEKKAAEAALVATRSSVNEIAVQLEDLVVDLSRKVKELEKKEEKKQQLEQQIQENEVNYKIKKAIQKDIYEQIRGKLEQQFNAVDDEIEGLIADLTDSL